MVYLCVWLFLRVCLQMNKHNVFDYIIIGAGTAGCAIANRLARNGYNLLLIEAGSSDKNIFIRTPIGYYKTIFNKKFSWNYWTDEIASLGNRKIFFPRGKVLGGCSSVNGLVYIQGQPEDFDNWESQGNKGWGWGSILPYFKTIQAHNFYSTINQPHPFCEHFLNACENTGIKRIQDFNTKDQEGCGYFDLFVHNGERSSSSSVFIEPIKNFLNLKLSLNSLVHRILFDSDKKAIGVEYSKKGKQITAFATKEIIISAGAINSPKILQLSGIGNRDYLKSLGIEIVHELPGVGENLQDHYQARLIYSIKNIDSLNVSTRKISWKFKALAQYILNKQGPLAIGAAQAGAFIKSSPSLQTPDLQLHFIPLSVEVPGKNLHSFSGITISVCQLRPKSRGYVRITSSNPHIPPCINPNYLSDIFDIETTIRGVRHCRNIFSQSVVANYIESEFEPGIKIDTNQELLEFIKARGTTIFHPAGTCKMGTDKNAVVDSNLKVHGIKNLRVADTSIMPTLISGNTSAAALMIGLKASDLILNNSPEKL